MGDHRIYIKASMDGAEERSLDLNYHPDDKDKILGHVEGWLDDLWGEHMMSFEDWRREYEADQKKRHNALRLEDAKRQLAQAKEVIQELEK